MVKLGGALKKEELPNITTFKCQFAKISGVSLGETA